MPRAPEVPPVNELPLSALETAAEAYRRAFGHGVPAHVATMFASNPGPLLGEIRQAIALGRPVPAWKSDAKRLTNPGGIVD
jgi:hypothetical protein